MASQSKVIEGIVKSILECPKRNEECPIALKFKQEFGETPVPEAYLGSEKAKLIIVGINPGATDTPSKPKSLWGWEMKDMPADDIDLYVETYQTRVREYLLDPFLGIFWQYRRVCEIFNYSPEADEVMITNLVHCPTGKWSSDLAEKEQDEAIHLCSQFCNDIIESVNPRLVILHGKPVVQFFASYHGWDVDWGKDIPTKRKANGRTFVLSRYLQRPLKWKALEKVAKEPLE